MLSKNKKAKIIAITFKKGGIGKSATSINLATVLAYKGYKVLLIDGDKNSTSSKALGVHDESKVGLFDIIVGNSTFDDAIQRVDYSPSDNCKRKYKPFSLYIIPSYDTADRNELQLTQQENFKNLLKGPLENSEAVSQFDYIIIDCPSESEVFIPMMYSAADYFIFPVSPQSIAYENMGISFKQTSFYIDGISPKSVLGYVFVAYENNETSGPLSELFFNSFENQFNTIIPRYKDYQLSVLAQLPIFVFYKETRRAEDLYLSFMRFADEVIERLNKEDIDE